MTAGGSQSRVVTEPQRDWGRALPFPSLIHRAGEEPGDGGIHDLIAEDVQILREIPPAHVVTCGLDHVGQLVVQGHHAILVGYGQVLSHQLVVADPLVKAAVLVVEVSADAGGIADGLEVGQVGVGVSQVEVFHALK